jgi:glutamate racemase
MKIGVFDSGIGGITVLKELVRTFPKNEYLYYGDTANVPYGSKSREQIRKLCRDASEFFVLHKVDVLIVACNTASSYALDVIEDTVKPIPVVGVVEPGVSAILQALTKSSTQKVLILGTKATTQSRIYETKLLAAKSSIEIFQQACPLWVPMIEEGWIAHKILKETIEEYVKPYILSGGIALLACTHYPWIQKEIEKILPSWNIINSAVAVVEKVKSLGLMAKPVTNRIHWQFSDSAALPSFLSEEIRGIEMLLHS